MVPAKKGIDQVEEGLGPEVGGFELVDIVPEEAVLIGLSRGLNHWRNEAIIEPGPAQLLHQIPRSSHMTPDISRNHHLPVRSVKQVSFSARIIRRSCRMPGH